VWRMGLHRGNVTFAKLAESLDNPDAEFCKAVMLRPRRRREMLLTLHDTGSLRRRYVRRDNGAVATDAEFSDTALYIYRLAGVRRWNRIARPVDGDEPISVGDSYFLNDDIERRERSYKSGS
jgi:hypothetical protein